MEFKSILVIHKKLRTGLIAFMAFVFSFPVVHLYTYHSGVQHIPRLPGSGIGYVELIFAIVLAYTFMVSSGGKLKYNVAVCIVLLTLFISYIIFIVLLHFRAEWIKSLNSRFTFYNIRVIVDYFIMFMIGLNLCKVERYRKIIIILFFVLVISTLMNLDPRYYLIDRRNVLPNVEGMYLFLGDSFAVWAILTISISKRPWIRFVVIVLSIVCLYALISRASFYAFLILLPYIMFKLFRHKHFVFYFTILAILVVLSYLHLPWNTILHSRQFGMLISGIRTSAIKRFIFLHAGLEDILSYWLLGRYGGQLEWFGTRGAYIHNYLSIWRQFGLFPFIMFVVMWGWVVALAARIGLKFRGIPESTALFFVLITAFVTILIVSARSHGNSLPFFVLGLFVSLLRSGSVVIEHEINNLYITKRYTLRKSFITDGRTVRV